MRGGADRRAKLRDRPIYAAQELLRILGVRFLAWDATLLPVHNPALPPVDMTFVPAFEYRDIDDWAALADPQQAQYFHLNPPVPL